MQADEYYKITGERAKKAVSRKVAKGGYPGCAPVGYKNVVVAGRRVIVPDEEKAPLIREAFAMHERGVPLRTILAELTPKGLLSRNGKPMGPSALRLVLANPVYRGWVRYEGMLMPGSHEPLIGGIGILFGTEQNRHYINLYRGEN